MSYSGGGGGGSGGGGAGGGGSAGATGGAAAGGAGSSYSKSSLDTAKAGAIRFNTDNNQMEIYDGNQWTGILATSPDLETGGTRAMMLAGAYPVNTDIQIFNIATTGNAVDSGFDYGVSRYLGGAASDRTRGVYFGGYSPSAEIRFNSIPSVGTTSDFGDLSTAASFGATGGTISTGHGGL